MTCFCLGGGVEDHPVRRAAAQELGDHTPGDVVDDGARFIYGGLLLGIQILVTTNMAFIQELVVGCQNVLLDARVFLCLQ